MGKILAELIKRHGFGFVMSAVALDGYRITVTNDWNGKKREEIQADAKAAQEAADNAAQLEYQQNIADAAEKNKNCAVMGRHKEAAEEHFWSVENYSKGHTEARKNAVERAKEKLAKSYDEVKELKESSFCEYLNSIYNSYTEYLDTLTPDKIVCVFNIIIGTLTLSSFVSILSIMLSENIIKRIKFLDRFPRVLALLKIRNNINKQIAKVYLFLHLVLILWGIICNIYMLIL